MGLDRVIEEILSAGEEKSRKLLAEAEAEKRKIVSTAKTEAERHRDERDKAFEHRVALLRQQALSSAELEAKKRILQEQNMLLSRTKDEVLRALSAMDANSKKKLLEKLSRIASKRLSKGVLHCREEDEKLVTAPAGFKTVADLRAAGGILAESADGSYRIDLTFEALLEDVWGKNVQSVYGILFGGA